MRGAKYLLFAMGVAGICMSIGMPIYLLALEWGRDASPGEMVVVGVFSVVITHQAFGLARVSRDLIDVTAEERRLTKKEAR